MKIQDLDSMSFNAIKNIISSAPEGATHISEYKYIKMSESNYPHRTTAHVFSWGEWRSCGYPLNNISLGDIRNYIANREKMPLSENSPKENDEKLSCGLKKGNDISKEVVNACCEILGCQPEWILKNVQNLLRLNKEYGIEIQKLRNKEQEKTEWNGEGLPPVALMCEVAYRVGEEDEDWTSWGSGMLKAVCNSQVWFSHNGHDAIKNEFEVEFRPLETEEQKAERENDKNKEIEIKRLADDACELLFGEPINNCRPDVAETIKEMIFAGYRKPE